MNFLSTAKCQEFTGDLAGVFVSAMSEAGDGSQSRSAVAVMASVCVAASGVSHQIIYMLSKAKSHCQCWRAFMCCVAVLSCCKPY